MTITKKKIKELNNAWHWTKDEGINEKGEKGMTRKNIYLLKEKHQGGYIQDALFKAHGDKLPDDFTYATIARFCQDLSEDDTEESICDKIDSIESDVYMSDLTAWLNSRCDRVYYLTEAIKNGVVDGFQALTEAQRIEAVEIVTAFYTALELF